LDSARDAGASSTTGTPTAGAASAAGASTSTPARSRKVRKILRLEARAQRLLAQYERALAKATGAMAKARALLDDAHGLEYSLTGTQLGELRRGRAEVLSSTGSPLSPSTDSSSTPASP
jgi:hypothetical protein